MTTTQDLEAPIKVEEATGSLQSGTAVTSQSRTKSEVDSLEPEADFPEGGWQAYLVIAGSWCCSFMTFGLVNTFGIYQSYYSRELLSDKTSSQIAWIGSFQYFGIFATGVFAGRAFDVGLFRPLLLAGMIILVVCQMLLSLCTEYWQLFLCQGVGLGLGFGIVFNLSVAVPSHWFKKRRATAMGILASGSSAGGICLPIMLTRLIEDDSLGFAWTNRVVGFLALIMFIFAFFTMQTRLQPAYSLKNGQWRHVELTKVGMFRIPAYSFFVLGAILILFGLYTPFQFMDTATSSEGIPADGYWLAILNAGSCVGRIVPGFLADRLGRMNTLVPHLGISSLILFIFPLCITSFGGLLPFSLIYGYGTGCYVSLIPSAIGQLVPTKDFGTALGQCFFIASFGALVGLPISGEILGTQAPYNWWAALGYSGACASAGTLAMVASRYYALQGKWRGRI